MLKYPYVALLAVIVAGVSFFGGMTYQKSRTPATPVNGTFQGRGGGFAGGQGRGAGGRGGFVGGSVLSKDDKSITVQLRDNSGSRIVFFSPSTTIGEMTQGSVNDIVVGGQVMVSGSINSDGSITAQSIQIRPADGGRGFGAPGGTMATGTPATNASGTQQ